MKRRLWLLFVLSLLASRGATLAPTAAVDAKAQGAASEVSLFFSAWDSKQKRFVSDLQVSEISISEEGKPLAIASLAPAREEPLTLGLLLDASGSRNDQFPGEEREPSKQFIQRVIMGGARGFVATFDGEIRAESQTSANALALAQAIDKVLDNRPYGPSAFHDSVLLAAQRVAREGSTRRILVILCDGNDTGSREGGRRSLEHLVSELPKVNVTLYFVVIAQGVKRRDLNRSLHNIQQLAEITGGQRHVVWEAKELQPAFVQIADEIEQQYVVRFATQPSGQAGKFRKAKLGTTRPDVKLTSAGGYLR